MSLFCEECGAKLDENAGFCQECGARVSDDDAYEEPSKAESRAPIIVLICSLIVILLCGAILAGYYFWPRPEESENTEAVVTDTGVQPKNKDNGKKDNDKNDEKDDDEIETEPDYDDDAVISPSIKKRRRVLSPEYYEPETEENQPADDQPEKNPTYLTFNDKDFNTHCAYPSHFIVVNNEEPTDRLRLISPDGTAEMVIGAEYNTYGINAEDAKKKYIEDTWGVAEYSAGGSTWYAVSFRYDGSIFYRKCFVQDNDIRWFDFRYPEEYNSIYDVYINYIEDNFKRNS